MQYERSRHTSPIIISLAVVVTLCLSVAWLFMPASARAAPAQQEDSLYVPHLQTVAGPFAPTGNVTIPAGVHYFSELTVPAGVTVTVDGDVTINVAGSSTISGTMAGECVNITLRSSGDLTLTGLIQHRCELTPTVVPDDPYSAPVVVQLVVDGAVQIGEAGSGATNVSADGSILLTDSLTENEPGTPIDLEEATILRLAAERNLRAAQVGPTVIDGALAPNRRGDLRIFRDGDVTINAAQVAANGADAGPAPVANGMCDASEMRGAKGGTISIGARNGTLRINANLTAGNGGTGYTCTVPNGCPATGQGGPGGRGGSVLVGGQSVLFGAGVTLTRGNGGAGGSATAMADDGANPCDDGCNAITVGGVGGRPGGIGYVLIDPGTIAGAPTEDGGNGGAGGMAMSTGGNGQDCDQCPGGDGGNGGTATSTGGAGADGSRGNIWPIAAGSHRSGDGGAATSNGGNGGNGADCCEKLNDQPGGDGGDGGDATATAGLAGANGLAKGNDGVAAGSGGDGGDGGDGAPPGAAGGAGSGTGTPNDIADGAAGVAGDPCPGLTIWFIYYSDLPPGPLVPGNQYQLPTYITDTVVVTSPSAPPPTGQVVMRPLTQEEFDGPVNYEKENSGFVYLNPGALEHDLSQLPDFPVISVEIMVDHECTVPGCVELIGTFQGEPVGQVASTEVATTEPEQLQLPPPEGAPVYDGFTLIAREPLRFFHWWVIIIDP